MQSVAEIAPIQTSRLCLRVFELADLDALAKINNDPEVMRHTGDGNTVSREETEKRLHAYIEHWQQHGFGLRAAIHKSDHAFVGFCGLQFVAGTQEIEVGFRETVLGTRARYRSSESGASTWFRSARPGPRHWSRPASKRRVTTRP